ncbi:molybdopterin molybdotransferase MoeA [Corynebacterium lizhenjunii]|uniref:Molybdopterin molybdenumtransferase n=1 Tax=Corynebacterium lizhenjunii TaxID=2709394 RepID=A0A7T0KFC2_9CORY|nr:molybdopterin molybdotransferase MoeA [Corynebacterium lizhenjunii]QPK79270.1 molybdopterin molybdotransferase MoeA [Corynebacterium lizhenjunii]
MRTYEEHLQAVRATVGTPAVVTRSVDSSCGMVLAHSVTARYDQPRFDNSQMDGYALASAASATLHVGATVAAGNTPQPIASGVATPIMTGAMVPPGTVAIVPVEDCDPPHFVAAGETVRVPEVPAGRYIRRAGSDVAAGTSVLEEGTRLSAAGIGTLAAQGIAEVAVYAPARILVVTGGAEIAGDGPIESNRRSIAADGEGNAGGGALGQAQIPDSNAPMLAAMAREYGIEIVGFLRTNDDPAALRAALEAAVRQHGPDAIVTSGGISHGKFEVVRQILDKDGWFGHVAQQPGGPQGISQLDGVPVLCLPGNPVSTLVSFRLYVAPVLGRVPQTHWARLTTGVQGLDGREQFRRAVVSCSPEGCMQAEVLAGAGSHLLAQAIRATALVRIPAGASLSPGDIVEVFPL